MAIVQGQDRELRKLLAEASQALAGLDGARLEEIAFACAGLVRRKDKQSEPAALAPSGSPRELLALGRVLEATRANLGVLRGLHDRQEGSMDYGPDALRPSAEAAHGDH